MIEVTLNKPADINQLSHSMGKTGFAKITNLFEKDDIVTLRNMIRGSDEYKQYTGEQNQENLLQQPDTTKAIKISSAHYRNEGTMLLDWLDGLQSNPLLAEILTSISKRNLLRTNDHIFEIASGSHPGLDWHVGYYSFSYIPISDYACTLWVPLDPVTEEQRGGMQYIEKDTLSGDFIYPFASWHFDALEKVAPGPEYIAETVSDRYMVNAVAKMIDETVPSEAMKEDTFDIGDAFFFDKNVIHKSAPFLEGPLKARAALIIRFVDRDAKFDRDRLDGIFRHISRSAKSNSRETEYFEKRDDGKLVPVDPFISRLVLSDAPAMTQLTEMPGLTEYMGNRLVQTS